MYLCQSSRCPLNSPRPLLTLYIDPMNETAMESKITISALRPQQVVQAGYKRRHLNIDTNNFLGFKLNGRNFSTLNELKQSYGVRNLKELEFETDRLELGSVTAEFYNTDGNYLWGAYLWNGAFRVGTSADRLVLKAV
jgi:hypothetical protein